MWPQRCLKCDLLCSDIFIGPVIAARPAGGKALKAGVELTGELKGDLHTGVYIGPLDIDVEDRNRSNPGLVVHFDRVVAQSDDEICPRQKRTLQRAPRPFDAA